MQKVNKQEFINADLYPTDSTWSVFISQHWLITDKELFWRKKELEKKILLISWSLRHDLIASLFYKRGNTYRERFQLGCL